MSPLSWLIHTPTHTHTFHWSACLRPGTWAVMYLCAKDIKYSFFYWILELLQQHGIFLLFTLLSSFLRRCFHIGTYINMCGWNHLFFWSVATISAFKATQNLWFLIRQYNQRLSRACIVHLVIKKTNWSYVKTMSCSGSHLGITINIKNTKFVKYLPMIDA